MELTAELYPMAVSVPETLSATSVPATLVWYCAPKWSGRHHPEGRVIRTCYVLGGVWLWGCGFATSLGHVLRIAG